MSFVDIEREFIREKALPDFDWTAFEVPTEPNPLRKRINKCRVSLVATAGAYISAKQEPFDTKSISGDDSFRVIPNETPLKEISLAHPGYDTRRARKDIDCIFPIALLNKLKNDGVIGDTGPRHFSFMGYVPKPERLIWQHAPKVGKFLMRDGVDLVILVPS